MLKRFIVVLIISMLLTSAVFAEEVLNFTSTQMVPAAEQKFAKGVLLKGFADETGIKAEFIPMEYHELFTRLSAEIAAKKVTISVVGDLHGGLDLMNAKGLFDDLAGITLPNRTFIKALEDYAVMAGRKVYVPWMQATYVMVVNKKAFEYLPAGLTAEDVTGASEKWTYYALLNWSKNLKDAFKGPKLGFPMGPKGLWHRFLHGYIHPSFTGYQAAAFDSLRAVKIWEYLKELLPYMHPSSSVWEAMDEPLLKEEVLVAWDHTARVKNALIEKPEDFAIVPVPCGPQGRGYITVAVGLAIPVDAPQKENAIKLIDHLTKPDTQVKILENVGFFPTVKEAEGAIPVGALKILATGVLAQSGAADSVMVMIPSLGAKGGEFTATYRDVFTKIVVEGADIETTITEAADKLRAIFKEVGVPLL
ncbi:MAG: ABC transporter substrate-binding protein [Candidatus Caldatribacteriota bacterium]|nr:ABC transporter substrate-binding protein [Candidatus Caldatribacteriota bacterium]